VVVSYGRSCPHGYLPVYSVGSEEEARRLLILACPKDLGGQFVAPELVEEQTIENLAAFSDRLHAAHEHLKKSGECDCV
jgi:hypothetical protein